MLVEYCTYFVLVNLSDETAQGCGIPMPDLSDSGLFVGGQVDFTRGLVHEQVNLREIQYHNIQFLYIQNLWQEILCPPGSRLLTRGILVDPVSTHSVIDPGLFG